MVTESETQGLFILNLRYLTETPRSAKQKTNTICGNRPER